MWMSGRGKWIIASALVASIGLASEAKAINREDCLSKNHELSIAACTSIIANAKETAEAVAVAHYNRGRSYLKLKKYKLALPDFKKAIAWNSNDHEAHAGLGVSYMHLDDLERSYASFSKAIEVKPDYIGGYIGRASVNILRDKKSEAKKDYRKVLSLDPTNKLVAERLRELGE